MSNDAVLEALLQEAEEEVYQLRRERDQWKLSAEQWEAEARLRETNRVDLEADRDSWRILAEKANERAEKLALESEQIGPIETEIREILGE